jgi:His-Xaa-Ser system protein HxsD
MMYKNNIDGNEIIFYVDSSIYSKDGLFKCLYWYGDKFHISINMEDAFFKISLIPQQGSSVELSDLTLYLQKLERDVIDFNLRDIVTKETKNIRELLIAKAFSNGEFDELPPGEISDPVGFKIDL